MTDMPTEVRDLIDNGLTDIPESELIGEDLLIEEIATLATAPSKWPRRPSTERRDELARSYRRKRHVQVIDDALLDHLKGLRVQRDEVEHTINLLLTYARTVPARDRKYPLRELAEASGIPISSIRDRISEPEMEEIDTLLNLDDDRLSRLIDERNKKEGKEV
ncbi:MAG: hypothetical protein L0H46_09220 [Brevibacterium sp.]|nr:hypothetical protein [Brevibacterium sp.]MDN5834056.1 hypothetical protein [Brevibacterium sp.]MDN5876493.1 hypothetical protein [Brevibacterium sp.]MDN6133877.1 hypothetical protein [Brevibacterium sp.]MDN6191552.1 hypothetical protein [Brevibacterium sp.]